MSVNAFQLTRRHIMEVTFTLTN